MSQDNLDKTAISNRKSLPSILEKEVEEWIVNSLKVRMIKKLDNLLEEEGRINSRQLFLVPIFTINEITRRVEETAPEMKTFFFKELFETMEEAEKNGLYNKIR